MSTHLSIQHCLADFPKVYVSILSWDSKLKIFILSVISQPFSWNTHTTFRAVSDALWPSTAHSSKAIFLFGSAFFRSSPSQSANATCDLGPFERASFFVGVKWAFQDETCWNKTWDLHFWLATCLEFPKYNINRRKLTDFGIIEGG